MLGFSARSIIKKKISVSFPLKKYAPVLVICGVMFAPVSLLFSMPKLLSLHQL